MVEAGWVEDVVEEAGGVRDGWGAVHGLAEWFFLMVDGCAVVAEQMAKVEAGGGVVLGGVVVVVGHCGGKRSGDGGLEREGQAQVPSFPFTMTKFRSPWQKSFRARRRGRHGWVTQQKPRPPSGLGVLHWNKHAWRLQ